MRWKRYHSPFPTRTARPSGCPDTFLGSAPPAHYATGKNQLYVNLYVGSSATVDLDGTKVAIRQQTRYPWEGNVKFSLKCDKPTTFDF
jgi:DUF1680 family protein